MELTSALVGGLIGGLVTLSGVLLAHWLEARRKQREDQETVRGFLQAILTELETNWNRYYSTAAPILEGLADGEAFENEVFIRSDFFTVYHNNSHLLGQVRDDRLRGMIVATYVRYKAFVDGFNVNTAYLENMKSSRHMFAMTGEAYYQQKAEWERLQLSAYAAYLKEEHLHLKQEIGQLVDGLRRAVGYAQG